MEFFDVGVSAWLLTGTANQASGSVFAASTFFEFRKGKLVKKDSCWKIIGK